MAQKRVDPRPTRLDHFARQSDLVRWLEERGLPVSKQGEENIKTMIRATGGRA